MNIQVKEEPVDKTMRRLKKVKISLMRSEMFVMLSGIMMVGNTSLEEDEDVTAYTNGRDETYGREFVKMLNDKELGFVMVHENFHKMYQHPIIWKKLWDIDHDCCNLACAHVTNLQITDIDPNETLIAFPRDKDGKRMGAYDTRFKNMYTKQVFDILMKEKKKGGGKGEGPGGFDKHGFEEAKGMSKEEKQELEREIDQAIRQGKIAQEKLCGKGKGGGAFDLGELLKPKVDWREELREFVKGIYEGDIRRERQE